MFVLTVTGGIGAGKSTAAAFFQERGAVVLELDDIAARLLEPGSPLLPQLVGAFGEDVLREDGTLDRVLLAQRAFASREQATRLNEIVHPSVKAEVGPALTELRLLPFQPPVVVLVVPLLAEAPVFAEVADIVLSIEAPEEARIARAVERGMSEQDARARLACQASDEERSELADRVIVNDGDVGHFRGELERFWEEVVAAG
jgi:dephospho-CoA kinase